MQLVIDLQACQSPDGRIRGVGRYCLSLALAMARSKREHDLCIAVNGAMTESVGTIRDAFAGVLPPDRIIAWQGLAPTAYMFPENRERAAASEYLREAFLESLQADVILTASMVDGFVDSVVTSVPARSNALQAAILFDLIPLVMPDAYLYREGQAAWYMRKIEHLKQADLLLAISESSRSEAIDLLGAPSNAVANISAAVGPEFRRASDAASASAVGGKYGITKSFVMYAGGFDPRKNLEALIRAYAALPDDVRATHTLVMVGNIDAKERGELTAVRDQAGLDPEELVFTGFVSDAELIRLYSACAAYVFPSLHEGFGLPALEAMSCGAIVIGADATSLPEVIGHPDALFDARSEEDMTARMRQALTDESYRARMREHGARQVESFSWERCASLAWQAIEAALAGRAGEQSAIHGLALTRDGRRKRVAVLSSAPTQLAEALLGGVAGAGVEVFSVGQDDGAVLPQGWRRGRFGAFDAAAYDQVIVHVHDDPVVVPMLYAVRGRSAIIVPASDRAPRVFEALAAQDRDQFHTMLYRWGGYHALPDEAAATIDFGQVPTSAIACLDSAWALHEVGHPIRNNAMPVVNGLLSLPGVAQWAGEELARLASAVSSNLPPVSPLRTLYVDISHLVIEDAKTGIQRVVRHVVAELMAAPPTGFRVEPIYIQPDGVVRYARQYCAGRFYPGVALPDDTAVDFRAGDIFIGLDLAAHLVPYLKETYQRMRGAGVDIHFVVYDLLPLLRPDCFDEAGLPTFRLWYEAIAELADGIICISRTVADEFLSWLPQSMPVRGRPLRMGWFHLGADLVPTANADELEDVLPFDLRGVPTFLMVGTIEPRKGHAQTLAAFELLWARGHDVNLVLIGKPGWRVNELVKRLRNHPEAGKRLHWLERADDTQLIAMYRRASALLAPSEGEGFGLPLIEAAQYGRPIIARDLPVFQEVAGEHAFYFSGMRPEPMADAVEAWLALASKGEAPSSSGMPWLTWKQSAAQLVDVAVGGTWYDAWMPGAVRHFVASDYRADTTTGELVRGQRVAVGARGLLFGTPAFAVTAGDYHVRIMGERTGGEGHAWVDIEAHDGAWRLASTELTEGEGVIAMVAIRLDEDVRDLRVRVMVAADASVTFGSVEISPAHVAAA